MTEYDRQGNMVIRDGLGNIQIINRLIPLPGVSDGKEFKSEDKDLGRL